MKDSGVTCHQSCMVFFFKYYVNIIYLLFIEEVCPLSKPITEEEMITSEHLNVKSTQVDQMKDKPEDTEIFGSWMLVKKPLRRRAP